MTDKTAPTQYVFGPVPSRRLGRSLGVDLVPRKVCTMDCVYCQVGRTTRKTIQRDRFVPTDEVLREVREKLAKGPQPDYITLSGSGEPTLNADLGKIVGAIKEMTDVPVAVLTNGSLLHKPDVRRDCARADLVVPSLDAGDEETYRRVNRPEESLTFDKLVEGLAAFRQEYDGPMWLEIFLVRGVNSDETQIDKIKSVLARIHFERVQLNTAVRPTADPDVSALTEPELQAIAQRLGPDVEIIADFRGESYEQAFHAADEDVLDMIRRRPVTLEDIAAGMGIHQAEAVKRVGSLLGLGRITRDRRDGKDYYRAV